MTEWHIITGEYPPQAGGVSDYTRHVARGLAAAGDRVCVWAPPCNGSDPVDSGVEVHRGSRPSSSLPGRLLVQYVPHAFGWKAMNIPFCLWIWSQRRRPVWVMFHEVAMPVKRGQPLSHTIIGLVNRLMARIVVRSAERIWVAIPAWEQMLRRFSPKLPPVNWLPVPSGIPVVEQVVQHTRTSHERLLLGHFGTYGVGIAGMLREIIPATLQQLPDATMLLLGMGSEEFAHDLLQRHPELAARLKATGGLNPEDLSRHISACDLMIQPYPDGVTSRRTSMVAALAHGRAVVTTPGPLTEPFWQSSTAVILVPAGDLPGMVAALAADPGVRERMAAEARALYEARFDLRHTIAALHGAALRDAPATVGVECASRS